MNPYKSAHARVKAILRHYSNPANPPLSVQEYFERFPYKGLDCNPAATITESNAVVACKDGMVRVRMSHQVNAYTLQHMK